MANINKIQLDDTEKVAMERFVHTPKEAGVALYRLAEQLYGTEGISSGSPLMDYFIPPNRPGWTRIWKARPGELKTTMLRIVAKEESKRIKRERELDKCVIIVTYEEAVDAQELLFTGVNTDRFWKGLVDPVDVEAATLKRNELPIYWIGESMMKSSPDQSPMSVNMVMAGINAIRKSYGLTPTVVLWDYIQETQVDRASKDRKQKIIDAMGDVIRMCKLLGISIDMGSQAKQKSIDNLPWPIPIQGDSEYSFYPEQKAQNVIGIWRVWNTHRSNPAAQAHGIKLQGWDTEFDLEPNLTVFRSSKTRYAMQRKELGVLIDPVTMTVKEIAHTRHQLSGG